MKLLYKIVLSLLILAVAVTAALILYYLNQVNMVYGNEGYDFGSNPKYHFSLILNSGDEKYWQDFKDGAFKAGEKYNAAIELNLITDPDANGQTVDYINIANKSRLNGIIVNGEKTEQYSEAIKNAAESGMGLVVGTGEAEGSIYVGTNFYDYGVYASELIEQAGGDKPTINLAVISSDSSDAEISDPTTTAQGTRMMSGLTSGERINLIKTSYKVSDLLGAEDLTRDILTNYPEVDVILCTNAKDTIAAARVIVERYLVGKVAIVGTDITEDIKEYINKGVIFGVLDRNGKEAGEKSVEVLCNADTFQTIVEYIKPTTYTKTNIDQWKND
jgi:ribose transport system substrate-binding protein